MTIKPLADRVLVKIEEVQEKTASGLYILRQRRRRPRSALLLQSVKGLRRSR
jgi:co-chaperonin GroES (HSP10)